MKRRPVLVVAETDDNGNAMRIQTIEERLAERLAKEPPPYDRLEKLIQAHERGDRVTEREIFR